MVVHLFYEKECERVHFYVYLHYRFDLKNAGVWYSIMMILFILASKSWSNFSVCLCVLEYKIRVWRNECNYNTTSQMV